MRRMSSSTDSQSAQNARYAQDTQDVQDSRLSCTLGSLTLKNPLIAASGTYAFGEAYRSVLDPGIWGAITLKSVTPEPRPGNPGQRIRECHGGLLNSIGLANPGLDEFEKDIIPLLGDLDTVVIASLAGSVSSDYTKLAARLNQYTVINAYELNLSCPNVREGGLAFGADPTKIEALVGQVRHATSKPLLVKLTPNVTSIADTVRAAEAGGADAIVMCNTFLGMDIDLNTGRPVFENTYAGFSGPPVFPLALRCVHQTAAATKLPVIGMGGVSTLEDVQKMILAGASAVGLGTLNFTRPDAPVELCAGLDQWVANKGAANIQDLRSN
ncbi:MAG TPA: dihydroorotate dehydrogenase [Firmicutes bacterium]|nr:dihydroorotate dehydrogenase [Bacillota bacterium]HCF88517.1 dihydroorotate dehydrogenase [Bacillota bacterium]